MPLCAVGRCESEGPAEVDGLYMCPQHFAEFLTKYCESCEPRGKDPYQPPFADVLGRRRRNNDFPMPKITVSKKGNKEPAL